MIGTSHYFKCKPSQLKGWQFSILSTKKDPDALDIVTNAFECYRDSNKVILNLLINGHGVKRLHKRFHKFDSVENPTPEEQAKMDKFAAVKAKHPKDYKLDNDSMDEIGIKGDYIGQEQDVLNKYPGIILKKVNWIIGDK